MKFIKLIVIIILLVILWILKPIISLYLNDNQESTYTTSNSSYLDDEIIESDLNYVSSYEKNLYKHKSSNNKISPSSKSTIKRISSIPKFKCDGRQHCSQMGSYEEAKYFITHCPKTKMDGDNDGIPCERQFGRYD